MYGIGFSRIMQAFNKCCHQWIRSGATFSAASVDDLHSEVTAPLWLNDSRDQVEQTRVLIVVYCHAAAMGSCLPSITIAKAGVAGAIALLQPISSSTQD